MTAEIDVLDLVDPARFARNGYPHGPWSRLRAAAPVARFDPPGLRPFWSVTKHADILEVLTQPLRFSSAYGILLARAEQPLAPLDSEMVLFFDPPQHRSFRRLLSPRFTPRAVRARREDIERIATEILDEAATGGDTREIDFVDQLAAPLPIAVISWILGVPRDDWRLLFRWTNEVIGHDDPEFRRPGETAAQTYRRARGELRAYLVRLVDERRREPRDDLVSELLSAEIDGAPLTDQQIVENCELFVEAGNETTRNAISGALLAFCEHPEAWEQLRADAGLLPTAVEEILRWVSPIIYFTRTATEECELHGQKIRAGDQLALYFASANRDEDVFDDPFSFRIDRRPNRHLAFGMGEHICLGAHVARVELETLLRHLLERLEHFELSGPVDRLHSIVNGGIKRLPLRVRLR